MRRQTTTAQLATTERKQVTVLFSDLSGYTALSERLDPEETREIMVRIFGNAAEIVGRYGGQIEKFIGDSVMAIFGVPVAHEDDPVRAVRAAFELHNNVAGLSPDIERQSGVRVSMHSGINTGVVVTGELKFDRGMAGPLGDTINLAARIMGQATEGDILVGPETSRLIDHAFTLEYLGNRELKGKAAPVAIVRVVAPKSDLLATRPFRAALIGRQVELGILSDAAAGMRIGKGSIIAISGDAGAGKSRLVEEFHTMVGHDIQWIEGRAYPYSERIPYFLLVDLLSRHFGIDARDSPATVLQKLEKGVVVTLGADSDILPVIAYLYDIKIETSPIIDREAFQGRLVDAVGQLFLGFASQRPTVICLQDLHWADVSTVSLFRRLSTAIKIPGVLLTNHRPGFEPLAGATVITLGELSAEYAQELLYALLGRNIPEELMRFVEARADGNPFFIEEIVNSLTESGVLEATSDGWRVNRALSLSSVPSTIQGVIAARIDRLDETQRLLLRTAAVVGREFLYSVVSQIYVEKAPPAGSLALQLSFDQLEAAHLILVRSNTADLEYIFKHALTQEVAYSGLIKRERQDIHHRTARAIEAVFTDRIPEFVEVLAYHFLHAGITERAVHYLKRSGWKCVERYAIKDAAAHYRNAYELLADRVRSTEENRALVELLIDWSLVFYYQGDCRTWRPLLERHLHTAESLGIPEILGMYLGWTGHMLYWHEEYARSIEYLDRAAALGEQTGNERLIAYAQNWRAWTLTPLGRTEDAIKAGEVATALGRKFPDEPYIEFKPLGAIALASGFRGDLACAKKATQDLFVIAERTGNSRARVLGYCAEAVCHIMEMQPDLAINSATAAMDASIDPGYRYFSAAFLGFSLIDAQRNDELISLLDKIMPTVVELSQTCLITMFRLQQDVATMGAGELSKGIAMLWNAKKNPSCPWIDTLASYLLGMTYSRIARGAVRAAPLALLRNPGFVFKHALSARRKAQMLLNPIADNPSPSFNGYADDAIFELALFHHHCGNREAARVRLKQATDIFESQEATGALRQVKKFRDSSNL